MLEAPREKASPSETEEMSVEAEGVPCNETRDQDPQGASVRMR